MTSLALKQDINSSRLLSVEEARSSMLNTIEEIQLEQKVTLDQMLGRILAHDLISPMDMPSFDNSAMDGYAFRVSSDMECGLPVSQRIAAGDIPSPLRPGSAARIFTGAMIPVGADTVVAQECCEVRDGLLYLKEPVTVGDHIRKKGHCLTRNQPVLFKGTRLQPQHIGLIATLGINSVAVKRSLRVALFTTGDELIEPGTPLGQGQIYNSNLYSLSQLLISKGCDVIYSGIIEDDELQTREVLKNASQDVDIIVTSGGVSVGEEDHVKSAVEAEGDLSLWKIRMKPGKPVAFGHIGSAHFIGLPGNPVSSYVTALLFLLPMIRKMTGHQNHRLSHNQFPDPSGYARLDTEWPTPRPRREFIRIKLTREANALPWAEPLTNQGSDVLSSLTECDALLEMPEFKSFQHGEVLRYWSLDDLCI